MNFTWLFVFEAPIVTSGFPNFLLQQDRGYKIISRVSQNASIQIDFN